MVQMIGDVDVSCDSYATISEQS